MTPMEWLGDRCPEQFRSLVAPVVRKPPELPKPKPPVVAPRLTQPVIDPDDQRFEPWMTPDNADF